MKKSGSTATGRKAGNVCVCMGGTEHPQCEEGFKMCPLGLQFVTSQRIRPFDLYEFSLDLGDASPRSSIPTQCTGAVVKCRKQPGQDKYRVWIKFLDIPEDVRGRIECVSKNGKHLCHYCENF